jgi:hypothetical protein
MILVNLCTSSLANRLSRAQVARGAETWLVMKHVPSYDSERLEALEMTHGPFQVEYASDRMEQCVYGGVLANFEGPEAMPEVLRMHNVQKGCTCS